MFHLVLSFLVPAILVALFYRNTWKLAYPIMLAGMVVDIDHLLANPIYDPGRCSIGFHPLHEPWCILLYIGLCFFPKTRLIGIGLTVHMTLDAIDCQINTGSWIYTI